MELISPNDGSSLYTMVIHSPSPYRLPLLTSAFDWQKESTSPGIILSIASRVCGSKISGTSSFVPIPFDTSNSRNMLLL